MKIILVNKLITFHLSFFFVLNFSLYVTIALIRSLLLEYLLANYGTSGALAIFSKMETLVDTYIPWLCFKRGDIDSLCDINDYFCGRGDLLLLGG